MKNLADRFRMLGWWTLLCLATGLAVHFSGAQENPGSVPGNPAPSSAVPWTGGSGDGIPESAEPRGAVQTSENGHNVHVTAGDGSPVTITFNGGAPSGASQPPEGDEGPAASVGAGTPEKTASFLSPDTGPLTPAPASLLDQLASPVRELAAELIEREGYREDPYEIGGHGHVCYGHRLAPEDSARPRTPAECISLLVDDLAWAFESALSYVGEDQWNRIGPRRQGVIVEIAYLTGHAGLMRFEQMQKHVRAGKWEMAVQELYDSRLPNDPENGGIGREALDRLALRLR